MVRGDGVAEKVFSIFREWQTMELNIFDSHFYNTAGNSQNSLLELSIVWLWFLCLCCVTFAVSYTVGAALPKNKVLSLTVNVWCCMSIICIWVWGKLNKQSPSLIPLEISWHILNRHKWQPIFPQFSWKVFSDWHFTRMAVSGRCCCCFCFHF